VRIGLLAALLAWSVGLQAQAPGPHAIEILPQRVATALDESKGR